MNKVKCATIIINWKRNHDTKLCLESLQKGQVKPDLVILIDNECSRDHHLFFQTSGLRILYSINKRNLGFASAVNQGINIARKNHAETIYILNNDVTLDPECLQSLLSSSRKKPNFILAPKILYSDQKTIWSRGGEYLPWLAIPRHIDQYHTSSSSPSSTKLDYLPFCAVLIPTKIINTIGLLDERYFAYYEDIDWCLQAKRSGYNLETIEKAIIYHKVSASTTTNPNELAPFQAYLDAKNSLLFVSKNFRGLPKLQLLFSNLFIKLPLFLLFRCKNTRSRRSYLEGVYSGLRTLLFPLTTTASSSS